MVKMETVQGVQNLPEIIVTAAGKNPLCVMIARGDLAVEVGYLRLAELQEEILWICEAADVPVVWGDTNYLRVCSRRAYQQERRLAMQLTVLRLNVSC